MTRTMLVLVAMACTAVGAAARKRVPDAIAIGDAPLVLVPSDMDDDYSTLVLDGPYVEQLAGRDGTCWAPVMAPRIEVHMPSLATLVPGSYDLVPVRRGLRGAEAPPCPVCFP